MILFYMQTLTHQYFIFDLYQTTYSLQNCYRIIKQWMEILKKDKYQQAWRSKLLKFKQSYVLGKYQDLIIHDEYIYPPVQKDIEEILVSQFGFSLLDQFIRNYNQQRFDKKNKLPLPIIFAIIHHHLKISKYQNIIKIILHHVDRTANSKYYIVTYIVAKIYEKFKQYKKSIFYLQNVLKEQPFFQQAVYDLCYHYAFTFQRQQQACILLQRHINKSETNNKLILPLYIQICSKFKIRSAKDVAKLLHNKSMNIASYFNLAIFLRINDQIEKAEEIFLEIIGKLSKAKAQQPIFSKKDEKLLVLSKVNLFLILQKCKNNNSAKNIEFYSRQLINEHKECLDAQALSRLTEYSLKHTFTQFSKPQSQAQLRAIKTNRQQKDMKKAYKKQNTENGSKLVQKQQNLSKLNIFNRQFLNVRQNNSKKLKYLLQKQKEVSNFFKNLVIKKDPSSDKLLIEYKIKDKLSKMPNQSIISKVNTIPHQYEIFQKEFQSKRKLHEFKYSNLELQSMLSEIITNFEDSLFSNKTINNTNSIDKQNIKIKSKVSLKNKNASYSKYSSIITNGNSLQILQKQPLNDKKIIKISRSKNNLKSQRSGYCFRIKQTSKQPNQLRQQILQGSKPKKRQFIFSQAHSPKKPQIIKQPTPPEIQQTIVEKTKESLQIKIQKMEKVQKQLNQQNNLSKTQIELPKQIQDPKQNKVNEEFIQSNKLQPENSQTNIAEQNTDHIQRNAYEKKQRLQEQQTSENMLISQTNCIEQSNKQEKINKSAKKIEAQKQQSKKSVELSDANIKNQIKCQESLHSSKSLQEQALAQEKQIMSFEQIDKTVNKYQRKQQVIFEQDEYEINEKSSIVQKSKNQLDLQNKIIQQPNGQNQKISNQPQPKKMMPTQSPIPNQIEPKTPQNEQQNQKIVSPKQIPYDPLASTFQLTGFNKSSLSKFRQVKRSKNNSIQLNNRFIFPSLQHRKNDEDVEKNSAQFEEQLKKAQNLQKQQQFQKAFQSYTRIYKLFKKQSEKQIVLIKIGSLFQKQQKYAQAQKTYLKCTKFNNVDAFLKLGALLIKNGRINSGVQNIEKANCIKRNDIQIQNKLVYGYSLRQQTMEKALTLAQMILKKQPQSLQTLIITANILQKQGKIKEAIQILTAIDKFKEAQYIKHYLGILYLQDSNLTEAFNYFKAALAIKPNFIPSLIEVATIISQISPKQSISILQKVLQVQPQNRKVLARLGKIYESIENDFENAMVAYQTALETQQNYQSYMKIGDCLAKQQSYIQALINYKQGLNLRKTHQAYAKVACMYQKKYQLVKAIENYQLALQFISKQKQGSVNSGKKKEYLILLGNLNIRIANYDASIKFFEEIEDHIESIDLLKLLAEAYFGKKQYDMALQRFEKANELAHGQNIQILEKIAICFDKMEEYLASKPIYEKILEKDPNNIRCLNNLANILLIIGETNQSFYLFQSMLQKAPKNLQKRLKVADIYAEVGDWSKVEFHLLQCMKLKENDERVIERLINLYKQKRDMKMANKYQKKLAIIKNTRKNQQKNVESS